MNHPQPLSKPHPPILIGGSGEKKTLRLVAQYADACNLFAFMGNGAMARKLDVLKGHCDAIGREYETIERTILTTANLGAGDGALSAFASQCKAWAALGIQHVIFNMPNYQDTSLIRRFGDSVIAELG